jgi:hypothetical protein
LPPHVPDMLAVRIQAIDGARTFTLQDSQPCRLLPPVYASPCTSRCTTQNSGPSGSLLLSRGTLAFPASCRFSPAHCIGDFASIENTERLTDEKRVAADL